MTNPGLLKYEGRAPISKSGLAHFEADCRPEVVFLLANHNPRRKALLNVLDETNGLRV